MFEFRLVILEFQQTFRRVDPDRHQRARENTIMYKIQYANLKEKRLVHEAKLRDSALLWSHS